MPKPTSRFAAFITELRRRRVFRVAAVYAGVAFVIIQIIDGAFGYLRIPEWVGTTVIVLVLLGFPIAITLAWAFDITDQGIVRTKGPQRHKPKEPHHFTVSNTALAAVAILAIIAAVWGWKDRVVGGFTENPIRSIAVLPLENLGGDPEQVYFVDGMHDAIISNLSRIGALKVISRTSAMRYKDTDKLMPEIARELGVDALVEGSVLKAGDRVRITAQLIHGPSDEHLWSNDYEGDLTDILALQKTVAKAIAQEIGLALKPEEEAYLASAPQVDPEAYQLYLKGWYFRELQTDESIPKAMDYLEQAVAVDSTFAQAYAALGWANYMLQDSGQLPTPQARQQARAAVERALALDDRLADAHVFHGTYLYMFEWDWAGAEAAFKRAIELNPNHLHAHYEYSLFLTRLGRSDEALAAAHRVREIDPLSPRSVEVFRTLYWRSGQYDRAIEVVKRGLELHPDIERMLFWPYFYSHRYEEVLDLATKLDSRFWTMLARMGLDQTPEAVAYIDTLEADWKQVTPRDENMSIIYLLKRNDEQALDWLEQAVAERSPAIAYIKGQPAWYPLYDHPRFQAILKEVGLE